MTSGPFSSGFPDSAESRQETAEALSPHRFLIAGMHRSGTSTVARIANLIGLDLGSEKELMAPAEDNPEGFWENERLTNFNEGVLNSAGGTWDNPPVFEPFIKSGEASQIVGKAQNLVESVFPNIGVCGWKDPRNSILGWLWGPHVEGILLCIREPIEVARSLQKRNEIDDEHSHRLWIRYTLDALVLDKPVIIVDLSSLVSDPVGWSTRIARFVGLPEPSDTTLSAIFGYLGKTAKDLKDPRPPSIHDMAGDIASRLYERLKAGQPLPEWELQATLAWVKEHSWSRSVRQLTKERDSLQLAEAALRKRVASLETAVRDCSTALGKLEIDAALDMDRVRRIREALGDDRFWDLLTS